MVPYLVPNIVTVRWTTDGIWAVTYSQTPTSSAKTIDVYKLANLMTGESKELWRSDGSDLGSDLTLSRDGKKVAIMRCTMNTVHPTVHSLYVCDIIAGSTTKLLSVAVRLGVGAIPGIDSFAFSPDGKRIAYAVEGDIYFSDL